jgi:endo-1,4-beta-xylanase
MITRRLALAAPLALAACKGKVAAAADPATVALKSIAPFPVGCVVETANLRDPAFASLFTSQFSQVTAGFEMKMEVILPEDVAIGDAWSWERPDMIWDFCKANKLRLHGHTLVWYDQTVRAFRDLDGKASFGAEYRRYIDTVCRRYAGAAGWDVVNEQINEDGTGLRDTLWSKNLGMDEHMLIAFETAHAADPNAVLFLNDYFLETKPRKRLEFMRLAERLLKKGAKLGGLGTQSHIDIDVAPGLSKAAIKDLASLGLPIHLSELDVGLSRKKLELRTVTDQLQLQAQRVAEVAEAFVALPPAQRYAFSVWGLRDKDSWLRRPPNGGDGTDQPLLFDDEGRPKPAFEALVHAIEAQTKP